MDDQLEIDVTLARGTGSRVGSGRIGLLRNVAAEGSITAAARKTGLSYRAAWDAVKSLNALFAEPLVRAAPGGAHGGGAELTQAGYRFLGRFENAQRLFARRLAANAPERPGADNLLPARIQSVADIAGASEIALTLPGGQTLVAITGETNVPAPGAKVIAIIDPATILLAQSTDGFISSARNAIAGHITARTDTPGESEIALDIGGTSLRALVTSASADRFAPGTRATALIKAIHVGVLPA